MVTSIRSLAKDGASRLNNGQIRYSVSVHLLLTEAIA
jgi:hypothetical protein